MFRSPLQSRRDPCPSPWSSSRPSPAPSLFLCLTCLSFTSAFQLIQHHDHLWLSCKHCLLAWSYLLSLLLLKIKSGSSSLKILVTLNEYVELWTSQKTPFLAELYHHPLSFSTLSTQTLLSLPSPTFAAQDCLLFLTKASWNFPRDELRVYRVSFKLRVSFISFIFSCSFDCPPSHCIL